jgi:Co/Zn/Cd efflux system component
VIPDVDNPMLMLIVACAGLASNVIAGAFLGVHDHSHGDEPGDLDVDPLVGVRSRWQHDTGLTVLRRQRIKT